MKQAKQITCSQKLQDPKPVLKRTKLQHWVPFTTSSVTTTTRLQQANFFSEKNTFDWYQYLESSTKHHFYEHIFYEIN